MLSIVSPAYNEAANLASLHERLSDVLGALGVAWEWIVVDDHSADATFDVIAGLARQHPGIQGVRLAHNFGSHAAIVCGLRRARGDAAIVMAADLQDPPETIPTLVAKWEAGAQVAWAVRAHREGETVSTIGFSRLYYWMMRHVVSMTETPATGTDFLLIDRIVLEALQQFHETNVSVLALITWMGYRQEFVTYDKKPRLHGRSGWTFRKKLKLVVDSVTSFTSLPIRAMSYVGFLTATMGFLYASAVIVNALRGHPTEGWSSLMVIILVVGGIQMLMMGVLGEYLWRALDESRRRPRYLIQESTESDVAVNANHATQWVAVSVPK